MPYAVRPARPDEWRQARRLRLEMLADTPIAFATRLADAEQVPDAQWEARARRVDPDALPLAVVDDAGDWCGQAVGIDRGGEPELVSVYLSPAARGQGLLGELVAAVSAWLLARGQHRLTLWVHQDNMRAQAAYARLGFALTGERTRYPLDPSRDNLKMEMRLGDAAR